MMRKKFIGMLFGVCTLVMFAGCYEPLEITDSEMDMVAEYAAGVLVKHGTKTNDALLDREEQEEAFAAMATPTPRPTLGPVQVDKTPSTNVTEEGEGAEDSSTTAKPRPTAVPDNTEVTMRDLTDLMGKKDFFFRYIGHKSTVLYQGGGEMFAAAGEGKKLVVLEFEVANNSDMEATLVLNKGTSKEFIYTLRTGNKTIRPSLTLLEEDFYTSYEEVYQPGEKKTCVLVFECEDDTSGDGMVLTVLRDVEGSEDSVLIKVK